MTSDSETTADTRNKHHRSSDGEAEENTKRRKHKHHRHHHRSKKRDEKAEDEVVDLADLEVKVKKIDDDDMEEGEIVEEDGEKLILHTLGADAVDNSNSDSGGGELERRDSDGKKEKIVMDIDQTDLEDGVDGNDFVSLCDNSDEKHKSFIHSPYPVRSPYELGVSKKSASYNPHDRSDSHSRSDVENVDALKAKQLQDWDIDHKSFRNYANESEEEISFRHDHSEHLRTSRSRARDEEREPSVNYSRYVDRRDWEFAKDVNRDQDDEDVKRVRRYERDRGSSRDERREKERKRSRTRERENDRSHRNDRYQDRQMEQDAGGKVDMESFLITERERNRGGERDRHRDTEIVDRQHRRERDRYKIKEKEKGRERECSVERSRDRDTGKHRDISLDRPRGRKKERNDLEVKTKNRSSERDREKERARVHSDDRAREQRREDYYRERENGQDKSRDRYWNAGRLKCDDHSSKRERPSEYEQDGNSNIQDQDKTKPEYTSRLERSVDSIGASEETLKREEEENEEYQETISLRLAEEEDDDINRIKEESRRRREAILEKYRNLKLQDQSSAEIHKGNEQENFQIHQSEQLISSSEVADVKPGSSFDVAKSPVDNGDSTAENTGTRGLGEGTPKSERPDDMFCDDIFGDTPTGLHKSAKGDGLPVERSGLHDNWDDAEGYYSYRFGELLDGRYEIKAAHGKGVFSSVVRAKDLKAGHGEPEEVAIKIIRNNETMFKAGQSELVILKKLVGADPEDRRHCVRFLSSFKYRNHLCLVFESLNMNLREVLKKFGRNIGLKLTAVRVYAKQLLIALKHLRNCGVLHCDIKPDNMLVNESKTVLKLCDFGNAMFAGKNEITPYLVSRFYRAPEIILGLTYDHPVDIWSVGCCLYELYTGKVLFPGATNNDMLRLHLELKGPFPKKMLRKGAFTEQHFDQDLNFLSLEDDPVTKKTIKRVMVNIKPKDIGSILTGSAGEDSKMLTNFKDLLDKIFMLDPDKRMTVSQALGHPFITGK